MGTVAGAEAVTMAGAAGASSRAYAAPVYDGPDCYRDVRPVHDAWGRYLGERVVRVCD